MRPTPLRRLRCAGRRSRGAAGRAGRRAAGEDGYGARPCMQDAAFFARARGATFARMRRRAGFLVGRNCRRRAGKRRMPRAAAAACCAGLKDYYMPQGARAGDVG